ncbi:hypothetical protein CDEST_04280 [Colletotrichum destructivum]|uniref:Uncharacterized protein n=1 Tax=Colletotrichum destructivum TaxID=34406 RepID=A0AAX4I7B2_9PEZI|nr:hypothetical protein CDEST_04280 [Colletotrichum destructivum]
MITVISHASDRPPAPKFGSTTPETPEATQHRGTATRSAALHPPERETEPNFVPGAMDPESSASPRRLSLSSRHGVGRDIAKTISA